MTQRRPASELDRASPAGPGGGFDADADASDAGSDAVLDAFIDFLG